jgi:hypothetical protein
MLRLSFKALTIQSSKEKESALSSWGKDGFKNKVKTKTRIILDFILTLLLLAKKLCDLTYS